MELLVGNILRKLRIPAWGGTGDFNIFPLYGTIITNHHERERLEDGETTTLGDDRTVQLYCGVPVRGLVGGDIQAGAI